MNDIVDFVVGLAADMAEFKRRFENSSRHGTVQEVDAEKQRLRLRIGGSDERPFLTPWLPYSQHAADADHWRDHNPPSKGQQFTYVAPDGDFRQGMLLPFTWSDDNPSPSSNPDERVSTFGTFKRTIRKDEFLQEIKRHLLKSEQSELEMKDEKAELKNGARMVRLTGGKGYLL